MTLRSVIVEQFRHPRGPLGHLAGLIMSNRPSNRQRSEWTVEQLALEPGQRVLEIGCGPGLALAACIAKTGRGHVLGIDQSAAMIGQAERRLTAEIRKGRAAVRHCSLEELGADAGSFDRVFSVNVVQFLPDLDDAFAAMHALLLPGGLAASTYQPRAKTPTRAQARAMAEKIVESMRGAGFEAIESKELPLEPVPAVCVTGRKAR